MSKLFSDKALLSVGIVLLLGNGWLLWQKTTTPDMSVPPTSGAPETTQLLRAGLLVPILNWHDSLSVHDTNNRKQSLNALLGHENKLVLRFSELSCNVCVDSELSNMKKYAGLIGHKNILVLATYKTLRDLVVFKRINQIEFPVYNIAETSLPVETAGGPFLFVANSKQKGFMPFIPDKEIPSLSTAYYEFISPLFTLD